MLDLSHRQDLAWLARLVSDVQSAAPDLRPLVVGALARDLWLHYGHDIEITRATEDADFAVAVDWKGYSEARDALVATGLFEPLRTVPHKLRHGKFGWIDLIPFGAVERDDGTIAWPPSGEEVMQVLGYAEAHAAAIPTALPHNQTVQAVSLPMLAVLKILAWKGRHRDTQGKDAVDLALIMRRYLEVGNLDRLYADFAYVINENFDFEPTGAWLLGRDARAQLTEHSARLDRMILALDAVLAPELDEDGAQTLTSALEPNESRRRTETAGRIPQRPARRGSPLNKPKLAKKLWNYCNGPGLGRCLTPRPRCWPWTAYADRQRGEMQV